MEFYKLCFKIYWHFSNSCTRGMFKGNSYNRTDLQIYFTKNYVDIGMVVIKK